MSAVAALRGYRTQFLYSLHYILLQGQSDRRFRLEGIEDLDVLDVDGNILQTIQVKNLRNPVVLSDIASAKENKTSFLKRLLAVRKVHAKADGILVSFGSISEELKTWDFLSSNKKEQYKIDKKSWLDLKEHVSFKEVDELLIAAGIENLLRSKYPHIDPLPTADLLLYWISVVAEKQKIISIDDIFNRVESIAKYLSDRIAIEQQYGVYISALHLDDTPEDMSSDILKNEFYQGVSARYAHIKHGLDVPRPKVLESIRQSFTQLNNIVVLHGASGQGKSTIAYRYAQDCVPGSLVYELNIQENPEQSRLAILSLQQMTKSLQTPVLLLIHVKPNSTAWLRIVREFAAYPQIQFLITIRQEDWYKALSAGANFLHKEIEMTLSRDEAELVYQKLTEQNPDLKHTDFDQAWIHFGEKGPMLEFVYTITQGTSLERAISQQVSVLASENNTSKGELLTILKAVSFADLHGARVVAQQLKRFETINSTLKRLEKEYLIKVADDKRHVVGLHPERSRVLVGELFDDFLNEKKDFSLNILDLIEPKDTYEFLLSLIASGVIEASDLIVFMKKAPGISWATYHGVFKSLLWCGIRGYLSENKDKMLEAYGTFGDAWTMLMDVFVGDVYNVTEFLKSKLPIPEEFRVASQKINDGLVGKDLIFRYARDLLNQVQLPNSVPVGSDDWFAYGELLFWLKQLTNDHVQTYCPTDAELKVAFASLPISVLAKVMFGMTMYDDDLMDKKLTFHSDFIKRLRVQRDIARFKMTDDRVEADFLIDVLKRSDGQASFHDQTIEIIDLIRQAYPEKNLYKSQGHGHKLTFIQLPYDDTSKRIPAKNLPFDEWVDINAILRQLFEYSTRPADWSEFCNQLQAWESTIILMFRDVNHRFEQFYSGAQTSSVLIPLVEYGNYRSLVSIKPPRSISDPFGISYEKANPSLMPEHKLKSKYQKFFDAYSDLRSALVGFFQQFGQTLYSIIKNNSDSTHAVNHDVRRLSFINFFNAIIKLRVYHTERQLHFAKYFDRPSPLVESELIIAAVTWRQFASGRYERSNRLSEKAATTIHNLKADFEKKLSSTCRTKSKRNNFQLQYWDEAGIKLPVIIVKVDDPLRIIEGLKGAFDCVKESIGEVEAQSLRYFMLSYFFELVYVLPLIKGNTLNDRWYPMPLHAFQNNTFESLGAHHFVGGTIDERIRKHLTLIDWTTLAPNIFEARSLMEQFTTMQLITQHLKDVSGILEFELDETGHELMSKHYGNKINESTIAFQFVLDFLANLINQYPEGINVNTLPEEEQQFWLVLSEIQKNIFPVPRSAADTNENYQAELTLDIMRDWSDRLDICSAHMTHLYFLLCGKYIADVA